MWGMDWGSSAPGNSKLLILNALMYIAHIKAPWTTGNILLNPLFHLLQMWISVLQSKSKIYLLYRQREQDSHDREFL